jgi:hypothetical protein
VHVRSDPGNRHKAVSQLSVAPRRRVCRIRSECSSWPCAASPLQCRRGSGATGAGLNPASSKRCQDCPTAGRRRPGTLTGREVAP